MLRSLNVWETTDDGSLALDEHGHPVALKSKRAMQPKSREEMSAGERRYVDVVSKEHDEHKSIRDVKAAAERESLLRAAAAMAAGAESTI